MGRSKVQAFTADNSAPCARASAAVALIARPLTALHAADEHVSAEAVPTRSAANEDVSSAG